MLCKLSDRQDEFFPHLKGGMQLRQVHYAHAEEGAPQKAVTNHSSSKGHDYVGTLEATDAVPEALQLLAAHRFLSFHL